MDSIRRIQFREFARRHGLMDYEIDMILAEPEGFMRDVAIDNRRSHAPASIIPEKEGKGSRGLWSEGPANAEAHERWLAARRLRGEG